VGTLAFGELVPPTGEDVGCLREKRSVECLLLQLCEAVEARVPGVAILGEAFGEGEPEKVAPPPGKPGRGWWDQS
jgi:hypothetical protein